MFHPGTCCSPLIAYRFYCIAVGGPGTQAVRRAVLVPITIAVIRVRGDLSTLQPDVPFRFAGLRTLLTAEHVVGVNGPATVVRGRGPAQVDGRLTGGSYRQLGRRRGRRHRGRRY